MTDDYELIQAVKNGHQLAFRDIAQRYQQAAYRFAYDLTGNHADAEDLSQEVFIEIYRSLDRFRGESQFSTWLYRLTLHTWTNQKRKRNSKLKLLFDSLDDSHCSMKDERPFPDQQTERLMFYDHVQRATKKLSPKEKSVFVLRQMQDQKLEDIAEIMNIKIGTVKSLLFRALQKMQKELAFYQHDDESKA